MQHLGVLATLLLSMASAVESSFFFDAKLVASEGSFDDHFGSFVDISEDFAIVGATNANSQTGAAYIFARDETWDETKILTASDGAFNDFFRRSVSISGGIAIVGAEFDDGSGSAYIFAQNEGGLTTGGN